ncbi:MAG TPA: ABC transporter permease, partial [Blastocatellia bacterium]
MNNLWQDLKYGARVLRKNPGFTTIAIITLALGIGANTAIFQLINALSLRSLPVANPQELTDVRVADMKDLTALYSGEYPNFTYPLWEQFRDHQEAFSGVLAWKGDFFNLAVGGEARYAQGLWVSGNFFNTLGVPPLMGRVFTEQDDRRGCAPLAVISYRFWQREFGGDLSVIGKTITLEGRRFQIIGVTPAYFFGLEVGRAFDVAIPLCSEPVISGERSYLDRRDAWWLTVMGRLKEGVSLKEASNQMGSISPGLFEATAPAGYNAENLEKYLGLRLGAYEASSGFSYLRDSYEDPLWLLLALAGLVLAVACANLTNLMLARASAREREIAVRLALGASRSRLIRQLLAESLLLAAAGAALGIFIATSLSNSLISLLTTQGNTLFVNLDMDWRVLMFTAGLATLTSVLFGLTPALRATRTAPGAVLKAGGRGMTAGRERFGLRRVLVVSQVALSLVLVVGALLFARSLGNLLTIDTGFQQDGILIASIDLAKLNIPVERRQAFKSELLERVSAIPGVDSAADTSIIPISGVSWTMRGRIEGEDQENRPSKFSWVTPSYFDTLSIPLVAGRRFDERDTSASPKVLIVNEAFARQFLNGENPVGKRFRTEAEPRYPETLYEIVGVVKNTKYNDIREEFKPISFAPASQHPQPSGSARFLIRSSVPTPSLTSAVTRAVGEVNPEIGINFAVFKTMLRQGLLREQLIATLSGFFGFLALLLACAGLYGVMSYSV